MGKKLYEDGDFAYIDKHCIGCHYYAGISDNIYYCSYFVKEDKLRPCPPGKDCTEKISRGSYKAKEKKFLEAKPKERDHRIQKNTRMVTYKGETKPLSVWAKEIGVDKGTLHNRIVRRGWSIERAMETPTQPQGRKKKEGKEDG